MRQAIQKKKNELDHLKETININEQIKRPNASQKSKSIQEQYADNDRNSTVYYLNPKTVEIYLFDKNTDKFEVKNLSLTSRIPQNYATVQRVIDDSIFVIGGLAPAI